MGDLRGVVVAEAGDGGSFLAVGYLQGLLSLHVVHAVESQDRGISLLGAPIGDKGTSSAAAGAAITQDVHVEDVTVVVEQLADVLFGGVEVDLSEEKLGLALGHCSFVLTSLLSFFRTQ